ncbi:conserved Plasmodium protein, unknown function [Plasmodium berghei]|uniref:Uncharacterized protein n=3 Tax=Plasmodium berghei TaxID=5821 RepID=A0A509AI78_PLABA|nr:conserved Plasmodium protein, unknown function [Plasmodium berghei ANKA]CXI42681.1 conserved Plasmodium protein, unknown function [Plasmodium berghei]SCM22167.1 conserved Plasmodium protein, unknown function [Plasmodium berghei]SCN25312.1 conserved Plasmodium protein, unknown function [Plasmodium berghei]SCO61966.1 conserved Plasmodium protein, unknown function [Plasmodium berghei]VUC55743.1 conserved Plasmodium protein, unknown function [Plasmodium berghei ANKA]|eukprot:XP_034421553.1 conserved Plasmodium protein, unknown function [Plasmodium berghei ANKA]
MINLIKLIDNKTNKLFACYPDIWKGYNSFMFFYILPLHYEEKNLTNTFLSILKNSENPHKNIYISLLLLNSNNFTTKIQTLKYIFYHYILINKNGAKNKIPDHVKDNFTIFLVENNSINVEKHMSIFFFSMVSDLIKQDYITLIKERNKKNNEITLMHVKNKMDTEQNDYISTLIHYSLCKNIFHTYFNDLENNIINEDIKLNEKNINKNNILDIGKSEDDDGHKNKQIDILKNENIYYGMEKGKILIYEIKDHYNENFLKGIFFYIKYMVEHFEDDILAPSPTKKKKNIPNSINKSYISCFLINCISILINICCFNKIFINDSYNLIINIKKKLLKYMNTSIVISMLQFVLLFSTEDQFFKASNYLYILLSKEYKNYLIAIAFFDFIMKNINILKSKTFFFDKYAFIILRTYFHHYRIFKNDLIYILPHLIHDNNYKDVFFFLLYTPLLINTKNMENASNVMSIKHENKKDTLYNHFKRKEEGFEKTAIQELDHINIYKGIKNKIKVKEIVKNMNKYFRVYFETILWSKKNEWIYQITKLVLYKLGCSKVLEILNKDCIKELLKGLNHIIKNNYRLLLVLKKEFINLLKTKSDYYYLISRYILDIIAHNLERMKITYDKIEDYYITLNSFFSKNNFNELKFWMSLIHAFTSIALYCHDLSNRILTTYENLIIQNRYPLILKSIIIENINLIKNISYTKNMI